MATASTTRFYCAARIIGHERVIEPGAVLIEAGHIVRIVESGTPQIAGN